MKLHQYQQNCIDDLMAFFAKTEELNSPQAAFSAIQNRSYYPPHALPEQTPYVCVRIPTGGGKTLMAANAVGKIAADYLHTKTPLCLWLAPSGAIVSQTLKSLQNREHPYRHALSQYFDGKINCISINDALRINKADLDSAATIIVCTIQSLRVEKTEGRKIYDDNGHLMTHFDQLSVKSSADIINQSLANVIKMHCPIVISDESHNAGTALFFEALARFSPACIVEWTATPKIKNSPKKDSFASNVISQASARELKEAGMIKFPMHMTVCNGWRKNIREAAAKREELEKLAEKSDKYIRPIVLYQAENKGGEATVEIVKAALMSKDIGIPEEHICVHTGTTRELTKQANNDLFARDCQTRHIITVQALAEGWDCSFAYILCTMANMHSSTAVEQILGRILRLPHATKNNIPALNECYTFAAKGNVADVAYKLKDTLVNKSGFQQMEADDFVCSPERESGILIPGQSPPPPKKIKTLSVPMLMVRESGRLVFLESPHFLGVKWSIATEIPDMSNFSPPKRISGQGKVDVNQYGEIIAKYQTINDMRGQLLLLEADKQWTAATLAAWLDAEILHLDIPQVQSSPYILAAVNELLKEHELEELAVWKFDIKKELERNINKLRDKKRKAGVQHMLKNMSVEDGKLEMSAAHAINFERNRYAAHWCCDIPDKTFKKHIFPEVGELKNSGEEYQCAAHLDNMPEIEGWVRNLSRSVNSFWLPTSSDKFYPDFVCRLNDGRILVVEYKGELFYSTDDSKEKRAIGEMWAKLSGGKCLFVMPKGMDFLAIDKCIKAAAAN